MEAMVWRFLAVLVLVPLVFLLLALALRALDGGR
jgi:hypothetical protein